MKNTFLASLLLLSLSPAIAQYNPTIGMQGDFNNIVTENRGSRLVSTQGIRTLTSAEVRGSQFFYHSFADGSVTTTNNDTFSSIYQFLFDKMSQELYIIYKADNKKEHPEIILTQKNKIRSFTIISDREHQFVAANQYGTKNPNDFYEVLKKKDSAYTLLKKVKTTFLKSNPNDLEKLRKGEVYDEFVDNINYYISYGSGNPRPVELKKKSMLHAFPAELRTTIENYFTTHDQSETDELFLVNLVDQINRQ